MRHRDWTIWDSAREWAILLGAGAIVLAFVGSIYVALYRQNAEYLVLQDEARIVADSIQARIDRDDRLYYVRVVERVGVCMYDPVSSDPLMFCWGTREVLQLAADVERLPNGWHDARAWSVLLR